MSTSEELAAWLRAAILARTATAEAATQAPWESEGDDPTDDEVWIGLDDDSAIRLVILRGPGSHENMLHVAANDPQDTIARCEAELAILDEHAPVADYPPESIAEHRARGWQEFQLTMMAEMVYCDRCHTAVDDAREDEEQCAGVIYPCKTVRLLASGYRHWPGYREEWKP